LNLHKKLVYVNQALSVSVSVSCDHLVRELLESVTFSSAMAVSAWSKHGSIAGLLAVRLTIVLSMLAWSQCFAAFSAFQAGSVPIFSHRRLLLSEVDFFVTPRTLRHVEPCVYAAVDFNKSRSDQESLAWERISGSHRNHERVGCLLQ